MPVVAPSPLLAATRAVVATDPLLGALRPRVASNSD
jgi:hypothetical protein